MNHDEIYEFLATQHRDFWQNLSDEEKEYVASTSGSVSTSGTEYSQLGQQVLRCFVYRKGLSANLYNE